MGKFMPLELMFVDLMQWDYDVASPLEQPLGGSQSAMCYLAVALAARGHRVTLMCGTQRPRTVLGVECVRFGRVPRDFLERRRDAVVVLNAPQDCLDLRPHLNGQTPVVLWTGHAFDQPAMQPLERPQVRQVCDRVVCVSDWHRATMMQKFGLEASRVVVMRNAPAPAFESMFKDAGDLVAAKGSRLILTYASTPYMGLELLLDIFPQVRREHPLAELHVYSSMKVYKDDVGDREFEPLYEKLRAIPGVTYFGSQPQPVLARAFREATVLTYPNCFPETSCIVVMEALAAGLHVVTSDMGGLAETGMGFASQVAIPSEFLSIEEYVARFVGLLGGVLNNWHADPAAFATAHFKQVSAMNQQCTWVIRAAEWERMIKTLSRR